MATRINAAALNEMLKTMSVWLRTASLGLFASAIIKPLTEAEMLSALPFAASFSGSVVFLLLSVLILAPIKEEK